MKKFAITVKRALALVIACLMAFSLVACGNEGDSSNGGTNNGGKATISVYFASTIKNGEKTAVVVAVSDGSEYKIVSGNPSILEVISETNGNEGVNFFLKVADAARVEKDTKVDVTVELVRDSSIKTTRSITVEKNSATSAPVMSAATKNLTTDSSKTIVRPGENNGVRLDVEMANLPYDDTSFNVTFDEPDGYEGLLRYDAESGTIVVADEDKEIPASGIQVTVTVTSNALSTLSKELDVVVKRKLQEGSVGDLTQDMLNEIANASITVTSTIKDVVKYNSAEDGTSRDRVYDAVVKMDGDRWYGQSNISGVSNPTVNANTYAKGTQTADGNYYVNELYVNKNNKSAAKQLKDSDSNPVVWYDSEGAHDGRHFWNHLSGLVLGKFTEEEDGVYAYDIEPGALEYDWIFQTYEYTPSEDEWLMAYVAWSFTPLLGSGDQFDEFRIILKDNGNGGKTIDKIVATTAEVNLYEYDEEGAETVIGYQNTVCTFTFSDIGSTVVADPAPYSAPSENDADKQYYDKLAEALSAMNGRVNNYTFRMVESQQYAPTVDSSDYDMSGTSTVSYTATSTSSETRNGTSDIATKNYLSASGDVGVRGYVTKEGALINETGQYTYAMDDYTYHTEVYGYKQNSDNTYETFEYSYENEALTGTRKKPGAFADLLPDFDVSPYIFTFTKMEKVKNTDKYLYTFALKDSAITSEVAYALTLADYASDAVSSLDSENSLLISVDSDGVLRSVGYAYDIASMYGGYYTTTYSDVNSTVLPEGIWDDYVARVVPQTWADFKNIKYYAEHSTIGELTFLNGDALVEKVFGKTIASNENFNKLPAVLSEVFRDGLNGPWHDYDENGVDSSGNDIYLDSLNLTVSYDLYDENYKIVDYYDDIISSLTEKLAACGFTKDIANSGVRGSSTFTTYVNQDLGIRFRVESNMTRTFWLYVETVASSWSLNG